MAGVRNKGVTQSVVPQANAMIDAEVSRGSRDPKGRGDLYDSSAVTVDALNNNTMVFYDCEQEIKNAKERSVIGGGHRARRVAVFQNYDGRSKSQIDECVSFAGVTISNANANGANVEQNSTAVVVHGTNSAQNASQNPMPIFARLRWTAKKDKEVQVRGMKPQRLFCVEQESDNRADRIAQNIIDYMTKGGASNFMSEKLYELVTGLQAAAQVFLNGITPANYDRDTMGTTAANGNGKVNRWTDLAAGGLTPQQRENNTKAFIKAILPFVEYDERHRVGFSLGTPANNTGQIDMHISRI